MALVALGVTGGIGAYKAVEVCRGLQRLGHDVVAVMTRSATRFVGPVTFEAMTRHPVITSQWAPGVNAGIEHINLGDRAAVLLVAPCTANVIGKFANGIADDFLTSLYLATKAPVLLAPAMNTNMLEHPAVRRNLDILAARGVRFVEPGEGYLACGWIGKGRLAEPDAIVASAQRLLELPSSSSLGGRRVLVTAGPTYEDIDAVRYVGNRSSGRMGYALAAEAKRRGAHVTVVSGPTHLTAPAADQLVMVRRAAEMHEAVLRLAPDADVVIMAAAVADYSPVPIEGKIAKRDEPLKLTLERTPDILAELGRLPSRADGTPLLVGFAAETGDAVTKAQAKRVRKQVDVIVANDVSAPNAGFDVETNEVTLVSAEDVQHVPLQSKSAVAAAILDRVERLIRARAAASPARA